MERDIRFDAAMFDAVSNLRIVANRTVGSVRPLPCYFPRDVVDIRDPAEAGETLSVEQRSDPSGPDRLVPSAEDW